MNKPVRVAALLAANPARLRLAAWSNTLQQHLPTDVEALEAAIHQGQNPADTFGGTIALYEYRAGEWRKVYMPLQACSAPYVGTGLWVGKDGHVYTSLANPSRRRYPLGRDPLAEGFQWIVDDDADEWYRVPRQFPKPRLP